MGRRVEAAVADGGPRGGRQLPEAAVRYIPVEGPIWGATILCAEKRQQRLPPAGRGTNEQGSSFRGENVPFKIIYHATCNPFD